MYIYIQVGIYICAVRYVCKTGISYIYAGVALLYFDGFIDSFS